MPFQLRSSSFLPDQPIPSRYTCDREDLSPPLAWTGAPGETRSFALIVDDPDAPDPAAPKRVWVHWILYGIPGGVQGLKEGVQPGELPPGTRQGINDSKRTEYSGPCPPIGRHRYYFRLYALDLVLPDLGPVTRAQLDRAMLGHVLGEAELMGTYARGG